MRKYTFILFIILQSCNMEKDVIITISTPYGDMKAILYDETPLHKENFIKLSESGQLDSTIFHRVINEFMIQGGNINLLDETNPIDYTIPAEINDKLFHKKGEIAAARMGDNVNPKKESSGSQFYIVQGKIYTNDELTFDMNKLYEGVRSLIQLDEYKETREKLIDAQRDPAETQRIAMSLIKDVENIGINIRKNISQEILDAYTSVGGVPHLDGQYTVFGRIVEGIEVIDKIASVKTGQADRPIEDIPMTFKLQRAKKEKITEMYGYSYPKKWEF